MSHGYENEGKTHGAVEKKISQIFPSTIGVGWGQIKKEKFLSFTDTLGITS
jgi:hypothetical protein